MIQLSFPRLLQVGMVKGTWEDVCISLFLILFGGVMSGLTLGLMSLDLVELEVLQRGGTPIEQKRAVAVLPIIKKQHQLLVTLVLCNAVAMEALPVFLDNMFSTLVAVILSVTFVLAFGEVIPQAICSRNGLAIGAYLGWLVRVLMLICFPIAYPVGKLLDIVLGHNPAGLFRRSQLKAFVSIHSKEEGKGGELSHDEITIIKGALDLTLKTAAEAMTPIESTYSIAVDSKLDWEALGRILATGHSRIPVYSGDPKNLIGLLLVKNLITVCAEDEMPVSAMSIRKLPRVSADTPLYDVLNEFQKGQSHMAAIVSNASTQTAENHMNRISSGDHSKDNINVLPEYSPTYTKASMASAQTADNHMNCTSSGDHPKDNIKALPEYSPTHTEDDNADVKPGPAMNCSEWVVNVLNEGSQDKTNLGTEVRRPTIRKSCVAASEEGEVIGIITLEDVFEELIQEEIVDETDEYVDVHKRIRVTTGALPVSSSHNSSAGQHGGGGISTNDRPRIAKLGGKCPSKLMNLPLFIKGGYNVREPLLDKT